MATGLAAPESALSLQSLGPLFSTLHFLRDFLSYGGQYPPSSDWNNSTPRENPAEVRSAVKQLLMQYGQRLTERLLIGMMYSFPPDVLPDASGALLGIFPLLPVDTVGWVNSTIEKLPEGSLKEGERERLINNIRRYVFKYMHSHYFESAVSVRVQSTCADPHSKFNSAEPEDLRNVRAWMKDFTTAYRRGTVTPREGLGQLGGRRFRFQE